jgi:hypothetical protein
MALVSLLLPKVHTTVATLVKTPIAARDDFFTEITN